MTSLASSPALAASAAGLPAGYGDEYRVVSQRGSVIAPATLERLELLDDALFAALAGDGHAVEAFLSLWGQAADDTPAELLEDSRRHYVRRVRDLHDREVAERLLAALGELSSAA
ncbi:MAG: hypothetical protein AAFV43_01505 [Planctomycetota bacterium]